MKQKVLGLKMLATSPVLLFLIVTIGNLQISFLFAMGTVQLNKVLDECQISLVITVHKYVRKFKRYLCRLKTFMATQQKKILG